MTPQLERSAQETRAKYELERTRVHELQLILDSRHSEPEVRSPASSVRDLEARRNSAASASSRLSRRSTDPNSEEYLKDQVTGLK